jgi:hypothetical protein
METFESIEAKLADLHLQRGHLALHGKDTSKVNAEIVLLHEHQATLQDLESAKSAQARDEVSRARQTEINTLTADIAGHNESASKAAAAADKALSEYCGLLRLKYQHAEQQRRAVGRLNALSGSKQTAPDIKSLQKQDSLDLLKQLRQVSGHEFGVIKNTMATKSL